MFLLCTVCFAFTACDNDDEDGVAATGKPTNPEKEVAGVYSGTWTQIQNGTEKTAEGTLTFEPAENAYSVNITTACSDFKLNYTSIANITSSYVFYNYTETNPFKTKFDGNVRDGVATISFTLKVKSGRSYVLTNYTFRGTKRAE